MLTLNNHLLIFMRAYKLKDITKDKFNLLVFINFNRINKYYT